MKELALKLTEQLHLSGLRRHPLMVMRLHHTCLVGSCRTRLQILGSLHSVFTRRYYDVGFAPGGQSPKKANAAYQIASSKGDSMYVLTAPNNKRVANSLPKPVQGNVSTRAQHAARPRNTQFEAG